MARSNSVYAFATLEREREPHVRDVEYIILSVFLISELSQLLFSLIVVQTYNYIIIIIIKFIIKILSCMGSPSSSLLIYLNNSNFLLSLSPF